MDKEEIQFKKIADTLANGHDVSKGKMMSARGIKYKNKFFAFYYNKEMIFRLGFKFRILKSLDGKNWRKQH